MKRLNLVAVAALACAACNPAVSETRSVMTEQNPAVPTEAVNERALGYWRLSAEGQYCLIALNRLPGPGGGFGVHVERCAAKGLAGAVRWRPDGEAVVIESAGGQALIRLMSEGSVWTGRDLEGVAWRMEQTPA